MTELNSLNDVLELCKGATAETLGTVTEAVNAAIVELALTDAETERVFKTLKQATGVTTGALKRDFSAYLKANNLTAEAEPATATVLVSMALESGMQLWHDHERNPHATIRIDNHLEHHRLKTKAVKRYLAHLYYQQHKKTPNSQALQDALTVLEAKAVFEGKEYKPYTRLAEIDGVIYLDLANPSWQVVRASAKGWAVLEASDVPVKFRRPRGMLALSAPTEGGNLNDLAALINVAPDSRDWCLIVAWLLQALRGVGSYPVLVLTGEQGSGKSTVAKLLRALLDPNVTPLRSLSRDERDLFIAAVNGWSLAFDNISGLNQWTSDALCKLSTGGGLSTRELFSDDEETLLDAQRPVVLNGITDFVDKQDLVSRALQVRLNTIPKHARMIEADMQERFDKAKGGILGALLDVVVSGLNELPRTRLEELPRLADFALWASACERGLGWPKGAFIAAYDAAQDDLIKDALEAEPVAVALLKLFEPEYNLGASEWTLTASELLEKLNQIEGHTDGKRPPKGWPNAAHTLSGVLRRIAPALNEQGLELEQAARSDAKGSKKWHVRLNRENKRQKRQKRQEGDTNTVLDGITSTDASTDASQSTDASSVRASEKRQSLKHRAGRENVSTDASDASKPLLTSDPPKKNNGVVKWEEL